MNVRPSEKFVLLVERVHGSVNAAAEAWEVHPAVLYKFMAGESGLGLVTAAQISYKTGVCMDELFVLEPGKGKPPYKPLPRQRRTPQPA